MTQISRTLDRLAELRWAYGPGAAEGKLELVRALDGARLATAAQVQQLHELLCFLRAYPDDAHLLEAVERALVRFERRPDLRRHRRALADSGIAGTAIHYRFFYPTARWLARRWPERLRLDWSDGELAGRLAPLLPRLLAFPEVAAVQASSQPLRARLAALAGAETDATFYLARFERLAGGDELREAIHDTIDAPYRLEPGPGGPSRSAARWSGAPFAYRTRPPRRDRPELGREMRRRPRAVRRLGLADGELLVALAREAMVTRKRDLDAFSWGNPADVVLVDDGDGLAFAFIGVVPERRLLLQAVHGALLLRNGVPIGYVQTDTLGDGSELSYNTFETFRGGEAAFVFCRLLAALGRLFDCRRFRIEPYQLGHHNAEGLSSGAWWFYWKLGFRPTDPAVQKLVAQELAALERDPGHRSSTATLRRLARGYLYGAIVPGAPAWNPPFRSASAAASRLLVERGGSDREGALSELGAELRRILGGGPDRTWAAGERLWWQRWTPVLMAIPDLARWSPRERRDLVAVVRAKGGADEHEFSRRYRSHRRLGRALDTLA